MANISDFVPYLVAVTGNLPEVYEQHFLRGAIQKFMKDTRIARDELYVNLDCNDKEFVIDLPECRNIVKVEAVWEEPKPHSGLLDIDTWTKLTPLGMARGRSFGTYRINKAGANPNRAVILSEGASKERRLCVEYSWTIGNDDCEVPDFILDNWVDAVIAGALIRAHSSLDFEQRNRLDKEAAQAEYDAYVNNALNLLLTDYSKGMIRLKTPRFF